MNPPTALAVAFIVEPATVWPSAFGRDMAKHTRHLKHLGNTSLAQIRQLTQPIDL